MGTRAFVLPTGQKIHIDAPTGKWVFPVGAGMIKNFLFDGKFVETRLFMHSDADPWVGYGYKWNGQGAAKQTDVPRWSALVATTSCSTPVSRRCTGTTRAGKTAWIATMRLPVARSAHRTRRCTARWLVTARVSSTNFRIWDCSTRRP